MTSLRPWTLQEKNENFKNSVVWGCKQAAKISIRFGIQQPDACMWAELKKNCYMKKIYKSIKFWREKFFFANMLENSLLGEEIIKWKNEKIGKISVILKIRQKKFKQKIGVRAPAIRSAHPIFMTSPNMKSLRSPIFPVSGLPITPRGIFRNFGNSPKIQMDVVTSLNIYPS